MKDFFDLDFLLAGMLPDRGELEEAIMATFRRRGTELPDREPTGLSDAFVEDKQVMWNAFLSRNGLEPRDFGRVVERIREGMGWIWTR